MTSSTPEPLSRTALGVAVGLAVALLVGVIVAGVLLGSTPPAAVTTGAPRTGPVGLVPVDAPAAGSAECALLVRSLPEAMSNGTDSVRRLPIAEPAPQATAAWGGGPGEPVVLRCGLNRPPELVRTAALREVSGVRWLPVTGVGATTWYAVDRAVYVALTIPDGTGTGPLQEISETIRTVLPAQPVRPGDG